MNYLRFLSETALAIKKDKKLPEAKLLLNHFGRWVKYQRNNDVFQQKLPWITFTAIDFLSGYLKPGMKVFEYGGGGSSLFFAGRVSELITVEHDRNWFIALEKYLSQEKTLQWSGNLIEPETADTSGLKVSDPNDYFSDDVNFKQSTFRSYASFIDRFADQYFDVVLVDGRARPSCMKHSLSKVKKDGLLILDNADRTYYLEKLLDQMDGYQSVCDSFGPAPYSELFTQTNIWRRIK